MCNHAEAHGGTVVDDAETRCVPIGDAIKTTARRAITNDSRRTSSVRYEGQLFKLAIASPHSTIARWWNRNRPRLLTSRAHYTRLKLHCQSLPWLAPRS